VDPFQNGVRMFVDRLIRDVVTLTMISACGLAVFAQEARPPIASRQAPAFRAGVDVVS
jgi:hypothetical protein